jgi:hypothetical protein
VIVEYEVLDKLSTFKGWPGPFGSRPSGVLRPYFRNALPPMVVLEDTSGRWKSWPKFWSR